MGAAALLLVVQQTPAAPITGYGGATGPGLGFVAPPSFPTPPPDPGNDNVASSGNSLQILEKRFANVAIIDMEFGVGDDPGPPTTPSTTTEYQVREIIYNDTGVTWTGHNVQLGYGVGAGFVPATSGDGLDFDFPDLDSVFSSGPFTSLTIGENTLDMSGGTLADGDSFILEFALDVPNIPASQKFTMRQLPIAGSAVAIPEPSAFALAALGYLAFSTLSRRYRTRPFKNADPNSQKG